MNALIKTISQNKFTFLVTFFLVFTVSYGVLYVVDFLPEPIEEEKTNTTTTPNEVASAQARTAAQSVEPEAQSIEESVSSEAVVTEGDEREYKLPVATNNAAAFPGRIVIDSIDVDVAVANPSSRTIADLDAALLNGVVRHPDSATLNQEGNIFILGHSSYLPTVLNRNFQAFNGIQKLKWGDTIKLHSADAVYEYRVEKVYKARAQDVTVPIAGTGNMLTLATCNSFGSVDDRYVVESKLINVSNI